MTHVLSNPPNVADEFAALTPEQLQILLRENRELRAALQAISDYDIMDYTRDPRTLIARAALKGGTQ